MSEGRWITLSSPTGKGTAHVQLDTEGSIVKGPKSLRGKDIDAVDRDVQRLWPEPGAEHRVGDYAGPLARGSALWRHIERQPPSRAVWRALSREGDEIARMRRHLARELDEEVAGRAAQRLSDIATAFDGRLTERGWERSAMPPHLFDKALRQVVGEIEREVGIKLWPLPKRGWFFSASSGRAICYAAPEPTPPEKPKKAPRQLVVTPPTRRGKWAKPKPKAEAPKAEAPAGEEHWITLTGPDGQGTAHVKVDGEGEIKAGPPALQGQDLDKIDKNLSPKTRKRKAKLQLATEELAQKREAAAERKEAREAEKKLSAEAAEAEAVEERRRRQRAQKAEGRRERSPEEAAEVKRQKAVARSLYNRIRQVQDPAVRDAITEDLKVLAELREEDPERRRVSGTRPLDRAAHDEIVSEIRGRIDEALRAQAPVAKAIEAMPLAVVPAANQPLAAEVRGPSTQQILDALREAGLPAHTHGVGPGPDGVWVTARDLGISDEKLGDLIKKRAFGGKANPDSVEDVEQALGRKLSDPEAQRVQTALGKALGDSLDAARVAPKPKRISRSVSLVADPLSRGERVFETLKEWDQAAGDVITRGLEGTIDRLKPSALAAEIGSWGEKYGWKAEDNLSASEAAFVAKHLPYQQRPAVFRRLWSAALEAQGKGREVAADKLREFASVAEFHEDVRSLMEEHVQQNDYEVAVRHVQRYRKQLRELIFRDPGGHGIGRFVASLYNVGVRTPGRILGEAVNLVGRGLEDLAASGNKDLLHGALKLGALALGGVTVMGAGPLVGPMVGAASAMGVGSLTTALAWAGGGKLLTGAALAAGVPQRLLIGGTQQFVHGVKRGLLDVQSRMYARMLDRFLGHPGAGPRGFMRTYWPVSSGARKGAGAIRPSVLGGTPSTVAGTVPHFPAALPSGHPGKASQEEAKARRAEQRRVKREAARQAKMADDTDRAVRYTIWVPS